jgi:hypothetical protein
MTSSVPAAAEPTSTRPSFARRVWPVIDHPSAHETRCRPAVPATPESTLSDFVVDDRDA